MCGHDTYMREPHTCPQRGSSTVNPEFEAPARATQAQMMLALACLLKRREWELWPWHVLFGVLPSLKARAAACGRLGTAITCRAGGSGPDLAPLLGADLGVGVLQQGPKHLISLTSTHVKHRNSQQQRLCTPVHESCWTYRRVACLCIAAHVGDCSSTLT
jgi:hypothetical protein